MLLKVDVEVEPAQLIKTYVNPLVLVVVLVIVILKE